MPDIDTARLQLRRFTDRDLEDYVRIFADCLPDSHEVEVLYRLDRAYWNQGLATEATKASLRYGFEQVQLDKIVALTLPHHLASRRVMEKAGLHYTKDAQIYGLNVVYYTLCRVEYQPDDSMYVLLV